MIQFPGIPFEKLLSPMLMWSLFGLVIAAYMTVTWVLFYHWNAYGQGARAVVTAKSVYIVVSMGIIASAFVSLVAV